MTFVFTFAYTSFEMTVMKFDSASLKRESGCHMNCSHCGLLEALLGLVRASLSNGFTKEIPFSLCLRTDRASF
jgi:hypothetical protein